MDIVAVRRHITHQCDGPITTFVLIYRAMELVENNKCDADTASNALIIEMGSYGMLTNHSEDCVCDQCFGMFTIPASVTPIPITEGMGS